jgi:Fic-DOC domain mobile mystery protein B
MKFIYAAGATPYNQDDSTYLIPKQITTQKELNEWEQHNIILAERWLFSKRRKELLTVDFLKLLHKKMFNLTWQWAGHFRKHQTNIGLEPYLISQSLLMLCDDVRYWIDNKTFPREEICMRFHHRLVFTHPFPNGNGRHARLMADAILVSLGGRRFSWGAHSLNQTDNQIRKGYIAALKSADNDDYQQLKTFLNIP